MVVGILILLLMFIRIISPRQIDDVHPNIPCENIKKYNPDVLWVIPLYEGNGISEDKEWCEYIKNLNKTIGMHGVYHEYREFYQERNSEYLQQGIQEFEACFGYKPEMFKPPQLKFDYENKDILEENNLKLKNKINLWTHKVYHCEDMSRVPNWLVKIV